MTVGRASASWLGAAIVLAVAFGAGLVLQPLLPALRVSLCELVSVRRAAVPVPPKNATPQETVTAYLRAVAARDDDAIQEMSTPSFLRAHGARGHGCEYQSLTRIRVGAPYPDTVPGFRLGAGVPAEYWVVQVDTGPEPDGPRAYTFLVVRDTPTERWRVADFGHG
ncbi:hypothetical protein [Spongiactinospora sp. 9N601]|uniref:hypothetical protein n=1 Tax=Spongiactinospora sp. 9N601 TaxID=3375149 RepID=UPI00379EBF6D